MPDTVTFKTLKDTREKVHRLLLKSMLPCENSEKQKAWDEIEELLQWVLEEHGENIHAVMWVLLCSKDGSELEAFAIHALYTLNEDKPFPGF